MAITIENKNLYVFRNLVCRYLDGVKAGSLGGIRETDNIDTLKVFLGSAGVNKDRLGDVSNIEGLITIVASELSIPHLELEKVQTLLRDNLNVSPEMRFLINCCPKSDPILFDICSNLNPPGMDNQSLKSQLEILFGENNLTEFGKKMREEVNGSDFVDLCCGDPRISTLPRTIARFFLASNYTGVDLHHVESHSTKDEFPELGSNFETKFIQDDILRFLETTTLNKKTFFFISGLERTVSQDQSAIDYTERSIKRIKTLIEANGGALMVYQCSGMPPASDYGFQIKAKCSTGGILYGL